MCPYIQQYHGYNFDVDQPLYGHRWNAKAWGYKHATPLHEIFGYNTKQEAIDAIKEHIDDVRQGHV